ncbi:uncharacterized protein LOC132198014 [Neocloeon triangulifer]|uniref:uncharacterized protein LOC132198014 n=1 Tax=Neocloeon triangulifer TaxID=2078957 RepID=UPI00286F0BF0|nr:uncharacterized protein LOC132198014 [Neocloeon triangulifer]
MSVDVQEGGVGGVDRVQCRLCGEAERPRFLFDIFGRDGAKHNLDLKIRKCLPIVVEEEDGMPRMVCVDCINRLDMVAVFVESCMRAHHTFLNALTNDPRRRAAAPPPPPDQDHEEVVIKVEPHVDDEIDLDLLPQVLRRHDPDLAIDDPPSDDPATVFIKSEPVEVNEED